MGEYFLVRILIMVFYIEKKIKLLYIIVKMMYL